MENKKQEYQLAQINVARIKGVSMDDPIMKEFVDNTNAVNQLAERSEGFIWQLKHDYQNKTSPNPYNDEKVIINVSVWQNVETLESFVYKTFHSYFIKKRKEWFKAYGKVHVAMWWIPKGHYPTEQEAVDKLDALQKNGASKQVFGIRDNFPKPE